MQPVVNRHYHKRKGNIETGMAFIVLGAVFMAMKLDLIHMEWRWYMFASIAFMTMGVVELVQLHRPHKIFEGLSKIALGAWFYIAFSGLWGITPANSWPLVLIVVGAAMVLKSLFRSKSVSRGETFCDGASDARAAQNDSAHNNTVHKDVPHE